jgi:dihydrofolate reductase
MQANGDPEDGRSEGFEYGGWQAPYTDAEVEDLIARYTQQADAFLFGRRTYEALAPFWPHVTTGDPVAEALNNRPKYVVSSTTPTPEWAGTVQLTGDLGEEVSRLKESTPGQIQVHGSGQLVRALLELGAVDLFRLWVHPIALGTGKRLFDGVAPLAMRVESVHTTKTGITVASYRVAGTPEFRGFGPPADYRTGPQPANTISWYRPPAAAYRSRTARATTIGRRSMLRRYCPGDRSASRPIGIVEITFGLWLLVKGVRPAAV